MKIGHYIFCALLTLIVGHQLLIAGMPYTHDGENHLARFANYKIALKEGQLPPRWAPNLVNHYGYPVFNYNYPLANLLSLPFSAFHISYEQTFVAIALFFIFFGGLGTMRWQRHWFATTIYFSSYYLVNLILFRGNIGELMAYGIAPWLFFSFEIIQKEKLSKTAFILSTAAWAALALAHNIALLMAVIGYSLYALINQPKVSFVFWRRQITIWILAALLSAWFWLPAIVELKYVAAAGSEINSAAAGQLLSLAQIVQPSLQFGYSMIGSIDTLGLGLGVIQVLILILIIAHLIKTRCRSHKTCLLGIVLLILTLLQTNLLKFFWQSPFLQLWQFPWRWQWLAIILLLPLSKTVWINASRALRLLLLLVLFGQLVYLVQLKPLSRFHKSNFEYDNFPQTTTTRNENMPKTFQYLLFGDWQPSPTVLSGQASIDVQLWNGTSREYQVNVENPAVIVEPTVNYAGWQTFANDSLIPYIDDDNIQGRLAYRLEPGQYRIHTQFYQLTWPRWLGNALSLTTALFISGYYLFDRKYVS